LKDQKKKEERRKEKKKDEKRAPTVIMREKSAIKKTKVPKALKIHTPNDSDEVPSPKEKPTPSRETLVEKDQVTSAVSNGASGPKESPLPEKEPVVKEDQNDKGGDQQDGKDKEVNFTFSFKLYFFFESLTVLLNISFVFEG
jgi:hypothetical protein